MNFRDKVQATYETKATTDLEGLVQSVIKQLSPEADRVLTSKELGVRGMSKGEWAKKVQVLIHDNLLTVNTPIYVAPRGSWQMEHYDQAPYKKLADKFKTLLKEKLKEHGWKIEDESSEVRPAVVELFFVLGK